MKGRMENDVKKAEKIRRILIDAPSYMEDYLISMSDKTMGSKLVYIRYILDFLDWLSSTAQINVKREEEFKLVKPSMVSKYLEFAGEGKGNSIKASRYYAISNFFKFLYFESYIDVNPCDRVPAPKNKELPKIVAMNKEEVKEVEKKILEIGKGKWGKRDLAIFMLGVTTGLRVTAISEINIEDINFEERKIRVVEKGKITKDIEIGDKVCQIIKEWILERNDLIDNDWGPLFISNQRTRISTQTIRRMMQKYTVGLNKHITPHKMRSTCATILCEETGNVFLAQNVLGHKSPRTTMRYAEFTKQQQKKATNVMNSII